MWSLQWNVFHLSTWKNRPEKIQACIDQDFNPDFCEVHRLNALPNWANQANWRAGHWEFMLYPQWPVLQLAWLFPLGRALLPVAARPKSLSKNPKKAFVTPPPIYLSLLWSPLGFGNQCKYAYYLTLVATGTLSCCVANQTVNSMKFPPQDWFIRTMQIHSQYHLHGDKSFRST